MERPMATDVLQVLGVACNLLDFARLYLDQFAALQYRKGKGYRRTFVRANTLLDKLTTLKWQPPVEEIVDMLNAE